MDWNKNIISIGQKQYTSKLGDPLISQGRELRSRRVIVQSLPAVLAGARMGQEDNFWSEEDESYYYDPDTTPPDWDYQEPQSPPPPGGSPEDEKAYANFGAAIGAGLGALTNVLIGSATGASVPPQGAKISSVQPQRVATAIRSQPELMPVSGEAAYQLLALSEQRQLSPEEAAMLQQLIYSRSQMNPSQKQRFDAAGRKIVLEQGGSDRLLQRLGNFFFGADKELTTKRAFTLEGLFTNPYFLTAAGTFLFLWMIRR